MNVQGIHWTLRRPEPCGQLFSQVRHDADSGDTLLSAEGPPGKTARFENSRRAARLIRRPPKPAT